MGPGSPRDGRQIIKRMEGLCTRETRGGNRGNPYRTHSAGELRAQNAGERVRLAGGFTAGGTMVV